ncbi:LysR family transcriptional regulator [Bradyrhizobium sp. Pha-3]|uniref:LysR family transcriptional regulator n=1 Tax=Bradyrhizobium sp. Pha-3 TaxID=208375 RepID=UPI0035D52252
MNFRQLETFLEIVRLGSFAAAANKLNATQSTISARIQELENDLGVVLFDRNQRKATVTAKGRELVGYAQRALHLQSEIRQQIVPSSSLSGIVRVGVAELVAVTWLPMLVATVRQRYPNITLELDVSLTVPLRSRLQSGELDIALLPGESFDPGMAVYPLGSVVFRWMRGANLAVPDDAHEPTDFASIRVLSLGEASVHYEMVSSWLEQSGSVQRPDLCNSMTVLSTLTMANVGVSLLPPICYESELREGRLRIIPTSSEPRPVPFAAVHKRSRLALLQGMIAEAAMEVSTFSRDTRPTQ